MAVVERLTPPRLEGTFALADGRVLGFAEYGAPAGPTLLWFHGTPGGPRQVPPIARELARGLGVRLIALARPGIGTSTPHLYADVGGWAADVGEVLDRLGIERFACVGLSGGGPYVLACAHRHPGRMIAGAVLGGVAPAAGPDAVPGGLVGLLAPLAPVAAAGRLALGRLVWGGVHGLQPLAPSVFDLYIALSPPGDRAVFERAEMRAMFLDDILHSGGTQFSAVFHDLALFTRPWGFSLRQLSVPLHFWHGDADHIVPLRHAEHMAALVPDANLTVRHGESHLGTLDAVDEVFSALLAHWDDAGEGRGRRSV